MTVGLTTTEKWKLVWKEGRWKLIWVIPYVLFIQGSVYYLAWGSEKAYFFFDKLDRKLRGGFRSG